MIYENTETIWDSKWTIFFRVKPQTNIVEGGQRDEYQQRGVEGWEEKQQVPSEPDQGRPKDDESDPPLHKRVARLPTNTTNHTLLLRLIKLFQTNVLVIWVVKGFNVRGTTNALNRRKLNYVVASHSLIVVFFRIRNCSTYVVSTDTMTNFSQTNN